MIINPEHKDFIMRAAESIKNPEQQNLVIEVLNKHEKKVANGFRHYSKLSVARQRAGYLKNKVINELDRYLIEFEDNFLANGGKIIWAQNAEEAKLEIKKIIKKRNITKTVKSVSMVADEIGLVQTLKNAGVEVIETEISDFINQLADKTLNHMGTPNQIFTGREIADLLHRKLGTPENLSPEETTEFIRKYLLSKMSEAEMSITGANFLVSDIGGIAISENEGNSLIASALPKIHLVVAGIDMLIPSMENLDLYWPLLASYKSGDSVAAFNIIITGPKKEYEFSGPEELILILIDNGRSRLLVQEKQRQALTCISCGACAIACPVYKSIGGAAYGTTYQGPIGAVVTPFMKDFKSYKHLSYASTLCEKCTSVCPVNIPLHNLLLHNRNYGVNKGFVTSGESRKIKWLTKAMSSRKLLDMPGSGIKNMIISLSIKKSWGSQLTLPKVARNSFNKLWKDQNKTN